MRSRDDGMDPLAEIISIWGIRDPFSMLSHLSGALLAVVGLVVLLRRAAACELSWRARLVVSVYAGSLFFSFTSSALFHYFPWEADELVFFKRLDHAAIFILIAGTCTVLLNAGRSLGRRARIAACWVICVAAMILKMIYWPMSLRMTAAIYLAVGWAAAASVLSAMRDVAWDDLKLLVVGMITYTMAAVVFATGAPPLWPGVVEGHELFHLMTLGGAAAHFLFVLRYCAASRGSWSMAPRTATEINLVSDRRGS